MDPRQTYRWNNKDPNEVLNRFHDWTPRLAPGEVITDSWAEIDEGDTSGVVIENEAMLGNTQTVKISGGLDGEQCKLTLRVEINGGDQIFDVGIRFNVTTW